MDDDRKWHLAWARFDALRTHQPTSWNENEVQRYHDILSALEDASPADDLSSFRIADSEMKHKLTSFRRAGRSGAPGSPTLSKDRYCDEQHMRRQMEAIATLFSQPAALTRPPKFGFK